MFQWSLMTYIFILCSIAVVTGQQSTISADIDHILIVSNSNDSCSGDASLCINDGLSTTPSHIYLGAALMLVGESPFAPSFKKRCSFEMSMTALQKYWLPKNQYPLILLNTRSWPVDEMEKIRTMWPKFDIFFENVETIFKSRPGPGFVENKAESGHMFPFNYRQMCAFFIKGFTEVPLLNDFKYLMRLDDDTCIENPINFDLFQDMIQRKTVYSYHGIIQEHVDVYKGMYNFTKNYMTSRNLNWSNPALYQATRKQYRKTVLQFTTNWEVVDMERYRQKDIMDFSEAVLNTGHVFDLRWGDAPIRYFIAMLFWKPSEVLRVCEFGYNHGNWSFKFYMCGHRSSDNPMLESIKKDSELIHTELVASGKKPSIPKFYQN